MTEEECLDSTVFKKSVGFRRLWKLATKEEPVIEQKYLKKGKLASSQESERTLRNRI